MKILLLDIETAPNIAYVWGLWNQNISPDKLDANGYTLCWAAKWLGERGMMFRSLFHDGEKKLIKELWDLLNEADAVVHYNGSKFDIPTINKDFLLNGYVPPSPYKQIDLLKEVRKSFRFPSNKLDYVAQRLKIGAKVAHEGHELWVKCMNNDSKAWNKMRIYNKRDVILLEDLYEKVLPWITSHPNRGLYTEDNSRPICTNCGSTKVHKRGICRLKVYSYQRYQCNDCGTWMRSRISEKNEDRNNILTQVK